MKYLSTRWFDNRPARPTLFFSEIDAERNEVRRVEVFSDGSLDHASESHSTNDDRGLSESPLPEIGEMNLEGEIEVTEITAQEFEVYWQRATGSSE